MGVHTFDLGNEGGELYHPSPALSDIDFWLGSKAYNVVECVHMMWLMAVVDMLVGKTECAAV